MDLRAAVRTIPDYPKPGIQFRDITTLLAHPEAFSLAVERLAEPYRDAGVQQVAGIEARGFILGGAIARLLGAGFVPLRKKGKLPHETWAVEYALEYGTDAIEMHRDALTAGCRVLLVDDLIATGGTAEAGIKLVRQGGGEVVGAGFVIDLPELGGAELVRSHGVPVTTLISFEGH